MIGYSSTGDSIGDGSQKKPHLRRSCEACRASKAKCIVNRLNSTLCERCIKDGRECIFAEARPRPKKVKTSKSRVAEMEQKLDGILSLLSESQKTQHSVPSESTSPLSSLDRMPSKASSDQGGLQYSNETSYSAEFFPSASEISAPFQYVDVLGDVIGRGMVSFDDAEALVQEFRAHAPRFPFVVINPQLSLDTLRREKPFLLLSILTMASTSDCHLQVRFEQELRQQLSMKTIMNGEKSIDILQGLIVYVTWYQFQFRPDRQQIYQLCQMAIAMAVDLDITRPPPSASQSNTFQALDLLHNHFDHTRLSSVDIEIKRTFLGCYYMSSCLAIGYRRTNTLKFTDYVAECCEIVGKSQKLPSDRFIPCLIQLQRLAEEVNASFDCDRFQELPPLGTTRTENLLQMFNKQLNELEAMYAPHISENITLKRSCLHLRTYIHEIGFHAMPTLEILPGVSSRQDWYSSTSRAETLLRCLEAAKTYCDFFLSISKEQRRQSTLMDLVALVYVVLILGKFVTGANTPQLDAIQLRTATNMGYYLEQLAACWNDHITFINGEEQMDYFWHARRLFQNLKTWYDNETMDGESSFNKSAFTTADVAFLRILSLTSYSIDDCTKENLDSITEHSKSQEELWSEIMDEWPASMDPLGLLVNTM